MYSIYKIAILVLLFFSIIFTVGAQTKSVKIASAQLSETSGLYIASPNLFFVHNDSGDTSRFFAIDSKGNLISTLYFKGSPANKHLGVVDCEDMAGGPGPVKNKNYVYLGDIGDNAGNRPYVSVYRSQQPNKFSSKMQVEAAAVHLKYPNGPQDAETLLIDPISKELIIISKRQDTVGIYAAPLLFKNNDTLTLKKLGSLFLPGRGLIKYVVSGDISRDGKQIIIKTYTHVYYWQRNGTESITQTLKRSPTILPYLLEPQGEAVGFTPDGKAYYCISEGKNAVIYRYTLPTASEGGLSTVKPSLPARKLKP